MPGYLLCIDASTPHLVLALGKAGEPAALGSFAREDLDRKNSEVIGQAVQDLCAQAKIAAKQIETIACGVGPGTFTGTRVAVATAKGLALGLGARLVPLDSLSIFAAPHAPVAPGLVVLDARRNEFYAATYGPDQDQGFARQSPVSCIPVDALSSWCSTAPQWISGSGAHLVDDAFAPQSQRHPEPPDPAWLWQASQVAMNTPEVSVQELDVFYLRASYAEIGANPPKTPPYHSPFAPSSDS